MGKKKFKIAIIGCGARSVPYAMTLANHEEVELVACADRAPSLPALLYGISEAGNTADLERVTPYLTHGRAAVVSAAMTANIFCTKVNAIINII